MNELLIIATVILVFGVVLLMWWAFGKAGLICASACVTILANIEVSFLVDAFTIEQTLGNVLFASTFLITDILVECVSKKAAHTAVLCGVAMSALFLVLSRMWLMYLPSPNDFTLGAASIVFGNTPRIIAASFAVYVIIQFFDVWMYQRWWAFTEKRCGNKRRFLWLRNTGATLVSQLLNTFLFTALAFYGTYEMGTLVSIFLSSFVIYVLLALADTPFVYCARRLFEKGKVGVFTRENNE